MYIQPRKLSRPLTGVDYPAYETLEILGRRKFDVIPRSSAVAGRAALALGLLSDARGHQPAPSAAEVLWNRRRSSDDTLLS
jgi:hypothetical protein